MDGFQVARLESVLDQGDFFITTTGNFQVITTEHLAGMKDKAVVGNVGHFDNEIDVAGLARVPGVTRTEINPRCTSGPSRPRPKAVSTPSSCFPRGAY